MEPLVLLPRKNQSYSVAFKLNVKAIAKFIVFENSGLGLSGYHYFTDGRKILLIYRTEGLQLKPKADKNHE
jgi:hypothetical protein